IAYAMILGASPAVWDILDLIFSFIALTGVFAYGYKKKLLSAKFWKYWLVAIILWDVIYNVILTNYLGLAQQIDTGNGVSPLVETLSGWILVIPEYIALYLLAFRSNGLWKHSV
ncbi:MAG: hypothetical protein ACXV2C_06475, partial [Candidatus Bathyarchaeia archaeon]